MTTLRSPHDVLTTLARAYDRQWRTWAADQAGYSAAATETLLIDIASDQAGDESSWPKTIPLGRLSRAHLDGDLESVGAWADEWTPHRIPPALADHGGVAVLWRERTSRFGRQIIPVYLQLDTPRDLAAAVGKLEHYERAVRLAGELAELFPKVPTAPALRELEKLEDTDVCQALDAAQALCANPYSGLYPRQLSVPGVDTKWIERHRGVLTALVGETAGPDFGLRTLPRMLDLVIADATARTRRGLPRHLAVAVEELDSIDLGYRDASGVLADGLPSLVLIVENRQCAVDLPDLPGLLIVHGLGNAAPAMLPGLRTITTAAQTGAGRLLYWGDMDLAGYSILSRTRRALRTVGAPLHSMLMSATDFTSMRDHATTGKSQTTDAVWDLETFEQEVVGGISSGRWGDHARQVEQEKIPTDAATSALHALGRTTPDI